jgi:hypothetical protein
VFAQGVELLAFGRFVGLSTTLKCA